MLVFAQNQNRNMNYKYLVKFTFEYMYEYRTTGFLVFSFLVAGYQVIACAGIFDSLDLDHSVSVSSGTPKLTSLVVGLIDMSAFVRLSFMWLLIRPCCSSGCRDAYVPVGMGTTVGTCTTVELY